MQPTFIRVIWIIAAASVALSTGCRRLRPSANAQPPTPSPAALREQFAYPEEAPLVLKRAELETAPTYSIRRVEISAPTSGQPERIVVFDYYDLADTNKSPIVLVLPVAGGSYELERHFAGFFARNGMAAIIVHREKLRHELKRIDALDGLLKQTVIDHKRVIDWLETQPDLDSAKVAVFGASLGGIKGVLLTALDERIQAAVLGLVGGNLPYILAHSTEKGIVKIRDSLLGEHNGSVREFEEQLRQAITLDPNAVAPYIDAREVLLVLAAYDKVVPVEKGWELWEKMGKPEAIVLPSGHYTAAVFLPYIQREALRFFQKRFGEIRVSP
ncbi:MAG: alpha/beta hydrolase [Verrucomicrobia bacterium]|nr:alpha/beta hydrolase [Verrucomicrobiota bacterium]